MKIGIADRYLDSFGGGERYFLTLASVLSRSHDVSVFWDDPHILSKAESSFGIDLSHVRVVPDIFRPGYGLFRKLRSSMSYDTVFLLTDGVIPISFARRNILHIQSPFPNLPQARMRLLLYRDVIVNSAFTLRHADPHIAGKAKIVYPPVDTSRMAPGKKRNIILSVGRFTQGGNAKKFDVLIDAFRQAHGKEALKRYELVLAGSLHEADMVYFRSLERLARGLAVRLLPNLPHKALMDLYADARIYWHAAGIGEKDPMNMEHFGMSVVEAMAHGCIVHAFDAGGPAEIITDGRSGYLYRTIDELVDKTVKNLESGMIQANARARAGDFSCERFTENIQKILED